MCSQKNNKSIWSDLVCSIGNGTVSFKILNKNMILGWSFEMNADLK